MSKHHTFSVAPIAALLLASCQSTQPSVTVAPSKLEVASVPSQINRDLDILFIVDNSGSMGDEQAAVAQNMPRFMEALQRLPGGLPNLHIGITTTDVGALGAVLPGCRALGDNGVLALRGVETTDGANFLRDIDRGGGMRERNYAGDLATVFGRSALVGTNGCGFEQPINATLKALDPTNAANVAFLRPQANLAVVIITDEDDCSAIDRSFFDQNAERGGFDSYTCFEQGVECDNDSESAGLRTNCRPREDSATQASVLEAIEQLIAIKGDPRKVMVAGVYSPMPTDGVLVEIAPASGGRLALAPGCTRVVQDNISTAAPAVRLDAFLKGFPGRSRMRSICEDNYQLVLADIGYSTSRLVESSCLDQQPATAADGQLDCEVSVEGPGISYNLARCSAGNGSGCYDIVTDSSCSSHSSKLRLKINESLPLEASAVARCKLAQ